MKIFLLVWALLSTTLALYQLQLNLRWNAIGEDLEELAWDALIHDKKLHIKLEECETELLNRRML